MGEEGHGEVHYKRNQINVQRTTLHRATYYADSNQPKRVIVVVVS